MDKYNRFFFGLSSVVVPFAVYFLVNHFFFAPTAKTLKNENGTLPTKNTANKKPVVSKTKDVQPTKPKESRKVKILYGTCTGTAKLFAEKLTKRIDSCTKFIVEAVNLKDYNEDKLDTEDIVLFICSTWTDGQPPESARQFFEWLKDYATDFRVSKNHLSKLKFAVFGLGGDIYAEHFAKAPKDIHEYLVTLGATAILPIDFGDDASDLEMKYNKWSSRIATAVQNIYNADSNSTKKIRSNVKSSKANALQNQQKIVKAEESAIANKKQVKQNSECCQSGGDSQEASTCCGGNSAAGADEAEEDFVEEEEDIINNTYITMDQVDGDQDVVAPVAAKKAVRVTKGVKKQSSSGCCSSTSDHKHSSEEGVDPNLLAPVDDETEHYSDDQEEEEDYDNEKNEALLDLEDLGSKMNKAQRNALKDQLSGQDGSEEFKREMVTKLQRKALTKEGYRIIGTHSAVKLCRWTKNQMRGRGGCYKHSFYGITSYQCMEATPSLACANKCVFCWRHHKNPVGTEWRWKEDEPAFIVNEAVELHRSMINEMRGVPGVQPERLLDAFNVRHCALSLVGEPIMYPRINEMLQELHKREISSFMVTNAQFPERIEQLDPVTQLYVSVDASNKESLKAIDRPLFKDFWERFLASLKAMAAKKQRTVYRMTLVSGWNMNEDGYVELIESGLPDFIEIKAMTYCGKSDASSLTMQNVPWHKDVCEYGEAICNRLVERGVISTRYSIATEHEHSCCILLAREDKFLVNGQWNTWINYPKFNALIAEYYASGKKKLFTSEDYMAPTPEWALYKSAARGFDPEEQRWHRNKTTGALVENEYKSSESGCG